MNDTRVHRRSLDENLRSQSTDQWSGWSVRWSSDWPVLKEHVRTSGMFFPIIRWTRSSDANHFNDTWLQKLRTDAGDNYRIKVKRLGGGFSAWPMLGSRRIIWRKYWRISLITTPKWVDMQIKRREMRPVSLSRCLGARSISCRFPNARFEYDW